MAVLAPMPKASVRIAIRVNPGLRRSARRPYRRSFHSEIMATLSDYRRLEGPKVTECDRGVGRDPARKHSGSGYHNQRERWERSEERRVGKECRWRWTRRE